jgi:hypothetical protein
MKKSAVLIVAAMLAISGNASAQDNNASSTTTSQAVTSPPARPMVPASSPTGPNSAENQTMVCRTGALIGSRLPAPKVCKTQWQWDEQRRIAKKEIDRDQIRGYSSH